MVHFVIAPTGFKTVFFPRYAVARAICYPRKSPFSASFSPGVSHFGYPKQVAGSLGMRSGFSGEAAGSLSFPHLLPRVFFLLLICPPVSVASLSAC